MTRLVDVKAGDKLKIDDWLCVGPGEYEVKDCFTGPYIECSHGRHYLDGQTDDEGYLIGAEKVS